MPEGVNSAEVVRHAYDRYSLSLGVGLAKVAGKVFRIGHLGWLNEIMVLQALAGAEMALRDVGARIKAGSGVGAAAEHFRHPARGASPGRGIGLLPFRRPLPKSGDPCTRSSPHAT